MKPINDVKETPKASPSIPQPDANIYASIMPIIARAILRNMTILYFPIEYSAASNEGAVQKKMIPQDKPFSAFTVCINESSLKFPLKYSRLTTISLKEYSNREIGSTIINTFVTCFQTLFDNSSCEPENFTIPVIANGIPTNP